MTSTVPLCDPAREDPSVCAAAPDASGTSPDPRPAPPDALEPLPPPAPPTGPQQWEGLLPRQLRR